MSGTVFAAPAIILLAILAYFASVVKIDLHGNGTRTQQKNVNDKALFETTWPIIKTNICPKMVPNIKYGRNLFLAAQRELGMAPIENSEELTKKQRVVGENRFWTFQSGGWIYTPKDGGVSTVYLRLFKAGNCQLMKGFGETILSKSQSDGNYSEFAKLTDISRLIQRDACIVTAVRDPISRFLSGYNEIEFRAAEMHPEWIGVNHTSQFHNFRNGTEERFEQFTRDFIGGPARDLQIQFGHIYSMSGLLRHLDEEGAQLTSYLPSLANLSNAFPDFLSATCPTVPKSARRPMSLQGQHETSADPLGFYSAAKQVWKQQGMTARALCAINAMDYACYDKLPVPPLCQEVFADEKFAQSLALE